LELPETPKVEIEVETAESKVLFIKNLNFTTTEEKLREEI